MAKSETLLAAITDKRERTDPYIPQSLSGLVASSLPHTPNTLPNGTLPHINGKASPFKPKMPTTLSRKTTTSSLSKVVVSASPMNEIVPFPDAHALLRTPEGMAAWLALDAEFSSALPGAEPIAGPGPSSLANIEERLRAYLPPLLFEDDLEDDHSTPDEDLRIGEKRKL
jgi:transcriptional activator SPT7